MVMMEYEPRSGEWNEKSSKGNGQNVRLTE